MEHKEAWQIAGMIFNILEEEVTVNRQHEKMADVILKYHDKTWDDHNQVWIDLTPGPKEKPSRPGLKAYVIATKGKYIK